MNKRIIFFGMLIMTIMFIAPFAMAYDASTPYTVTMTWSYPEDTAFSVTLAGTESAIIFNITTSVESYLQPRSQVANLSIPIINISNDGNVAQNFSANLTAAKPAWAILMISSLNDSVGVDTFDTTGVTFATDIAVSGGTAIFLWTNVSSPDSGETSRTFQINSIRAAA